MSTAKQTLWCLCVFSFLYSTPVLGETDPYNYIASQGSIGFTQGGATQLPLGVLQSVSRGEQAPIMQFILLNSMMSKCVKNTLKTVPARRDPFKVANKKFADGYCKIRKCFEQGMLLGMLSQLSSTGKYSESSDQTDQQGSQMMAMALAQAFKKEDACGGGGAGGGIDPALLQVIGN